MSTTTNPPFDVIHRMLQVKMLVLFAPLFVTRREDRIAQKKSLEHDLMFIDDSKTTILQEELDKAMIRHSNRNEVTLDIFCCKEASDNDLGSTDNVILNSMYLHNGDRLQTKAFIDFNSPNDSYEFQQYLLKYEEVLNKPLNTLEDISQCRVALGLDEEEYGEGHAPLVSVALYRLAVAVRNSSNHPWVFFPISNCVCSMWAMLHLVFESPTDMMNQGGLKPGTGIDSLGETESMVNIRFRSLPWPNNIDDYIRAIEYKAEEPSALEQQNPPTLFPLERIVRNILDSVDGDYHEDPTGNLKVWANKPPMRNADEFMQYIKNPMEYRNTLNGFIKRVMGVLLPVRPSFGCFSKFEYLNTNNVDAMVLNSQFLIPLLCQLVYQTLQIERGDLETLIQSILMNCSGSKGGRDNSLQILNMPNDGALIILPDRNTTAAVECLVYMINSALLVKNESRLKQALVVATNGSGSTESCVYFYNTLGNIFIKLQRVAYIVSKKLHKGALQLRSHSKPQGSCHYLQDLQMFCIMEDLTLFIALFGLKPTLKLQALDESVEDAFKEMLFVMRYLLHQDEKHRQKATRLYAAVYKALPKFFKVSQELVATFISKLLDISNKQSVVMEVLSVYFIAHLSKTFNLDDGSAGCAGCKDLLKESLLVEQISMTRRKQREYGMLKPDDALLLQDGKLSHDKIVGINGPGDLQIREPEQFTRLVPIALLLFDPINASLAHSTMTVETAESLRLMTKNSTFNFAANQELHATQSPATFDFAAKASPATPSPTGHPTVTGVPPLPPLPQLPQHDCDMPLLPTGDMWDYGDTNQLIQAVSQTDSTDSDGVNPQECEVHRLPQKGCFAFKNLLHNRGTAASDDDDDNEQKALSEIEIANNKAEKAEEALKEGNVMQREGDSIQQSGKRRLSLISDGNFDDMHWFDFQDEHELFNDTNQTLFDEQEGIGIDPQENDYGTDEKKQADNSERHFISKDLIECANKLKKELSNSIPDPVNRERCLNLLQSVLGMITFPEYKMSRANTYERMLELQCHKKRQVQIRRESNGSDLGEPTVDLMY